MNFKFQEIQSSLDTGIELYNDRSSQFDIVKGIYINYIYIILIYASYGQHTCPYFYTKVLNFLS